MSDDEEFFDAEDDEEHSTLDVHVVSVPAAPLEKYSYLPDIPSWAHLSFWSRHMCGAGRNHHFQWWRKTTERGDAAVLAHETRSEEDVEREACAPKMGSEPATSPLGDDATRAAVLRLRRRSNKLCLTWKKWHMKQRSTKFAHPFAHQCRGCWGA